MANIFTLDKFDDFRQNINLEELYEKKRQKDLNTLTLFNKILHRIHVKIKTISRKKFDEQCCWYLVPEIIIGVPRFDVAACIAYLMDKLKENGFNVRYFHPNLLFIVWNHYIPAYVREEIQKKTGMVVDEFGNKKEEPEDTLDDLYLPPPPVKEKENKKSKKEYTPIHSYKPMGSIIYKNKELEKLEEKLL